MNICLGTVQFGLDYGVSNTAGKVSDCELKSILQLADEHGIRLLDTASNYGDAERRLGRFRQKNQNAITKISTLDLSTRETVRNSIQNSVSRSLKLLKIKKFHGILIHDADSLTGPFGDTVFDELNKLREKDITNKIGISVYFPDDILKIMPRYEIDMVQMPMNILDQRFLNEELLSYLKKKNVEIHVRSAFLQGLLLMHQSKRPDWTKNWNNPLQEFDSWCDNYKGTSRLKLCLDFFRQFDFFHSIVVGVQNHAELSEIITEYKSPIIAKEFPKINVLNERLIVPSLWP